MAAINVEAVLVCVACLSTDRKLFPLNSFTFLSHKIFMDIGLCPNGPESVCWECKALIEKYTRFYKRAQKARIFYNKIEQSNSVSVEKLSTLSTTVKNHLDAVYVEDIKRKTVRADIDFENEINTFGIGSKNNIKIETNDQGSDTESEFETEVDKTEAGATQHDALIKEELPIDCCEPIHPEATKFTVTAEPLSKPATQQTKVRPSITLLPTTSSVHTNSPKPPNNILYLTIPKIVVVESLASQKDCVGRVFDGQLGPNDIAEFNANIGKPAKTTSAGSKLGTVSRYQEFETIYVTDKELTEYLDDLRTRRHYMGSNFKCEDCIVFYGCAENLEKHMEVHRPNKGDHVCPICKQRFTNLMELYNHKKAHYKLYKCVDCTFRTHSMRRVLNHWRKTHDTEAVYCRRCDAKLPPNELRRHYVTAHMESAECDTCRKRFKTKYLLTQHIKSQHNTQKVPKAQCKVCNKLYLPSYLQRHMKNIHERENKNENTYCIDCDISFKSELIYKSHLKNSLRHIQPECLRYECDYCKRRFSIKSTLSGHIEECHLRVARYPCHVEGCREVFISQRFNTRHFRKNHSGKSIDTSKYVCDICGKGFSVKKSLREHANFHTGERPFKCDKCDATFMYTAALFTHNKLVHLKIKRPADLKKKTGRRRVDKKGN